MTKAELWEAMMDSKGKMRSSICRQAFATLTRDIAVEKWSGKHGPNGAIMLPPETWEAGKRVRVVMASRFGDVGITDNLAAKTGYHYRVTCISGQLTAPPPLPEVNLEPAGLLTNIAWVDETVEARHAQR